MPKWFALALFALGATMIVVGLRQSARARQARGWTRTLGTVLESRVERQVSGEELMQKERFEAVVRYAYDAHGRRHESGRIGIGSPAAFVFEDAGSAQRLVERFPAGAQVPVWFDPADPRRAALVLGLATGQTATAIVLGLALVAAAFFALARAAGR